MKRKTKLLLGVYLALWIAVIAFFWLMFRSDDALFFSLVMTTVTPVMTAILSYNVGKNEGIALKAATVVFSGIMFMLQPFLTFDLLNSLTFHHANYPEPLVAGMGAIISLIFVIIGAIRTKKLNSTKINTGVNTDQ